MILKKSAVLIGSACLMMELLSPFAWNPAISPSKKIRFSTSSRLEQRNGIFKVGIVYDPTPEEIAEEEYDGEREVLAQLVAAEALNQNLKGKRLVADVVLNRVKSPDFPDTISGVIYQDKQFSAIKNGAFDAAAWTVTPDCFKAVRLETEGRRLDSHILYFTAGNYNRTGTPAYQYGDHFFSSK